MARGVLNICYGVSLTAHEIKVLETVVAEKIEWIKGEVLAEGDPHGALECLFDDLQNIKRQIEETRRTYGVR